MIISGLGREQCDIMDLYIRGICAYSHFDVYIGDYKDGGLRSQKCAPSVS